LGREPSLKKTMKGLLLVLSLLGSAGALSIQLRNDTTTSPVEKVVGLLSDLKAKIIADGKAEEMMYNKYACWCEKTSKRKAADIEGAEADLRALSQKILKLKGKVETLASEIKELKEGIEEAKEEQEEATAIRSKENAAYQASTEETKTALAAMEKAVGVLIKGSSALVQTDTAARTQAAVRNLLNVLPAELPRSVSSEKVSFLGEFAKSGQLSGYAPQSATIQGILGDMYTTFSVDLESATSTEATKNADFEALMYRLDTSILKMEEEKSKKEGEKADAESDLADTTANYDSTEDQMKADIEFFDETKKACASKHKEWEIRADLREEELEGVLKAISILSSDATRELMASAIKPGVETMFLQLSSDQSGTAAAVSAVKNKAYELLKAGARKSRSLRLGMLAVRMRNAKVGHFDAVISEIDKMIDVLKEEGAADIAKKDECKAEYQKIGLAIQDLDWKIKNNLAKIARLEKDIEFNTKEKADTIDKIKETEEFMKKITDERTAENEAFKQAKLEDEAAIKVLNAAKAALTKFYKKNKVDMGPVQGSVKFAQDPDFKVSADQAPDATFSGKGSRKLGSKNIVSLMDYIIQDLEDEITNGKKDEAKNQADYEDEMDKANNLVVEMDEKVESLSDTIAKKKDEKTEEQKTMKQNNKEKDAEEAYKAKIKPDCDWMIKNFDGRADARAAEMGGLTTAKEFLAGKAALLQLSSGATSSKVAHRRFRGFFSLTPSA